MIPNHPQSTDPQSGSQPFRLWIATFFHERMSRLAALVNEPAVKPASAAQPAMACHYPSSRSTRACPPENRSCRAVPHAPGAFVNKASASFDDTNGSPSRGCSRMSSKHSEPLTASVWVGEQYCTTCETKKGRAGEHATPLVHPCCMLPLPWRYLGAVSLAAVGPLCRKVRI